jgi:hypothetical protein
LRAAVQAVVAAAAIGLNLLRAIRRPALRKTVIAALVIAAACAAVGTLTDRTSLCRVGDLVQGHAVWHVLAAAALWRLASVRIAADSAHAPADEQKMQPTTTETSADRQRLPAALRAFGV